MSDESDTREVIQNAIAHLIEKDDGDHVMVINFLAVAEVIGPEGEPWLKTIGMEGMLPWAACGMATALTQITAENLRNGWEGDE